MASGVPFTIIAPAYFMENLWNPWNLPVLAAGRFPSSVPPARRVQQIAVDDVVRFAAHVLDHRDVFVGQRIEVASDELNALEAAQIVSELTGSRLEVDGKVNGGPLPLFSWLDRVGYAIDVEALRRRFPEIAWRRFEEWARSQEWSIVTSQAG
jgi:uncharacterized protein YbjT (DUF2867 family)